MVNDQIMNRVAIFYATLVLVTLVQISGVKGDPQVPCFFIFADSLADPGNNNVQLTVSRANYRPYGVDFPGGVATGRYSNGLTTVDYLAKKLGFSDFIPPFASDSSTDVILNGINYASASAGIRDESGLVTGFVISMNQQLRNHEVTVSRIVNILGSPQAARDYLNKCLYFAGMGNNDYQLNYFLPLSLTSIEFNPEEYAQVLIDQYRGQLKRLYDFGARKVALAGVPPLGCLPFFVSTYRTDGSSCVDRLNSEVQLFNNKLVELVDEFNSNFSNAKFTYLNYSGITFEALSESFRVTRKACCRTLAGLICLPLSTPCANRTEHAYFDGLHPTTANSRILAERTFSSLRATDTYPIDINRLVQLRL